MSRGRVAERSPATGLAELHLWRVFPWDDDAPPGAPFSPQYVPVPQGSGRFDLGGRPPVVYLAETAAHAVGEKIQRYRGQTVDWPELTEFGKRLAIVEVVLAVDGTLQLADLDDPRDLLRYECRPDDLMSRDVSRTQHVARTLYDNGVSGFRVWSALTGDWHSYVLFVDRIAIETLRYQTPERLELDSPAVREAARMLSITIAGA